MFVLADCAATFSCQVGVNEIRKPTETLSGTCQHPCTPRVIKAVEEAEVSPFRSRSFCGLWTQFHFWPPNGRRVSGERKRVRCTRLLGSFIA